MTLIGIQIHKLLANFSMNFQSMLSISVLHYIVNLCIFSYFRTSQELETSEICGCYGGRDSYRGLLICDTVLSGRLVSAFHMNIQPASLGRLHSVIVQEATVCKQG
jgi:hypothetical protein